MSEREQVQASKIPSMKSKMTGDNNDRSTVQTMPTEPTTGMTNRFWRSGRQGPSPSEVGWKTRSEIDMLRTL